MTFELVFRKRVLKDVAAIIARYQEERLGLGDEFQTAVEVTFRGLTSYPERFAVVVGNVRRALVPRFPYAVFYAAEPKCVVLLRVLHTARNPSVWPSRGRR